MADKNPDYEIGHCRPPKQHQFPKGQSGNLEGRPKGAKDKFPRAARKRIHARILAEAEQLVMVREDGEPLRLEIIDAILKGLFADAARGDFRSRKLALDLYRDAEAVERDIEAAERAQREELFIQAEEYVVSYNLAAASLSEDERKDFDPFPRAEEFSLDYASRAVSYSGPPSPEHHEIRVYCEKMIEAQHEEIECIEQALTSDDVQDIEELMTADLQKARERLAQTTHLLTRVLPCATPDGHEVPLLSQQEAAYAVATLEAHEASRVKQAAKIRQMLHRNRGGKKE